MLIKKKNVARLASISALGAGALGVAAGTAQAGDIVYTALPPDKVGFSSGYGTQAVIHPPGAAIGVKALTMTVDFGTFSYQVKFSAKSGSAKFQLSSAGFLGIFPHGESWTAGGAIGATVRIAARWPANTGSYFFGNRPFNDQYALFKFYDTTSSRTEYGWLELSLSIGDATGPDVTLSGWAYDDSGAKIAAGDTGGAGVPEPSTMALTGLAALALGAAGLRRWRAARKPAA